MRRGVKKGWIGPARNGAPPSPVRRDPAAGGEAYFRTHSFLAATLDPTLARRT